jgi:adenylylsulfate kinase-like enzyme
MDLNPEAVLITGVYGTGKTSVTEEIAARLDEADAPYAAIDLDWLIWANVEGGHGPAAREVLQHNLASVAGNYLDTGITRFVLAGYVEDASQAAGLARAIGMPMKIVRLVVPLEVIERRIGGGPVEELEVARAALAGPAIAEVGDLVLDGERPLPDLAAAILEWLGWLDA